MRTIFLILVLFRIAQSQLSAQDNPTSKDSAQYDLIDLGRKWFGKKQAREEIKESGKVRFSIIPASNASGRISISAINLAYYLGDPEVTNLSTTYFYPYTNFSGRYYFAINSYLWAYKNLYNAVVDLRIASNEIKDYGLGSLSSADGFTYLDYNMLRIHVLMNRLIIRYLYFGLGYYLDEYDEVKGINEGAGSSDFENYPYGTETRYTTSGLVLNLLRDSRKNSLNPSNGFYTNLSYQFYHPALGSTYRWDVFLADARKYFVLPSERRQIIGLRFLYWGTFGNAPYLDLPATFTDREARMGRGYYYARFRGGQLLYGESEYRFNITRNGFFGGVLFAGIQSFTTLGTSGFFGADPSVGFGFRLKFNKQSDANLTFDVGFGRNSINWHLNLGEFF